MASVSAPEFWTDLYARGGDGWDLRQPSPPLVEFVERDIFTLPLDHERAFDGVWEYTCFCAIDPERRAEYVRVMGAILRPGGWMLACFFPMRRRAAGPPFAVSEGEVRRLFTRGFRLERAYRPWSVRLRQGQEWMALFRRTGAPA